jgi:glycine oxidase
VIIVVGGGIAGLSLGWQLTRRGAAVSVLEQDRVGSGASGVATSYLEPRVGGGAMRALEWASVEMWPGFAGMVEDISGRSIDYRRNGQLRIAFEDTLPEVRADAQQRQKEGWTVEWLEASEARNLEPNLSEDTVAAAYLSDVGWLDGRRLCLALAEAISKQGGEVYERTPVSGLVIDDDRIAGVTTQSGVRNADGVVLCTGFGGSEIASLPDDVPRCRPVKGTILTLGMDRDAPAVTRLIKSDRVLCPRGDGRLHVGSTHEENPPFDAASAGEVCSLLDSAVRMVPILAHAPLLEVSTGIRGFVGDGLLRLGQSGIARGLYYSVSHAGAGFLRAPAISSQFAEFILSADAACPLIDKFLKR